MDELAARVKADPVAFRLRHLSDSRLSDVVKARRESGELGCASLAQGAVRSKPAWPPAAASPAWPTKATTDYAAMVAEVEVDQDTGKISVKRIVVSNDCRPDLESRRPAQPDRRRRAAGHEPRARRRSHLGRPESHLGRLGAAITACRSASTFPKIEVVLLNRPDQRATGAGETSITIVAAAIGNAIFDATGARLRQVPFTPERVKAALSQATSRL